MNYKIICPNTIDNNLDAIDYHTCKIFLAGPVAHNKGWRLKVITDIDIMMKSHKDIDVAFINPQWNALTFIPYFTDMKFIEKDQIAFESKGLSNADIIIFGLFNPNPINDEKAWDEKHDYAQTTRYELGRYSVPRSDKDNSVIIYGEEGFKGLSYIKTMTEMSGPSRYYTGDYNDFLQLIRKNILYYSERS